MFYRFHESHGYDTNEWHHLRDVIEEYIRKKKLQQFNKDDPVGPLAGPSVRPPAVALRIPLLGIVIRDPQKGTNDALRQATTPEMEIHSIIGCLHEADRSWATMERFIRLLWHKDEAICSVVAKVNYTKLPRTMNEEITFGDWDFMGTDYSHIDPLVITVKIGLVKVHWILVDNRSSVSLLYKYDFNQMGLSRKDLLPCANALQGFFDERKEPLGVFTLPIDLGVVPRKVIHQVQFVV